MLLISLSVDRGVCSPRPSVNPLGLFSHLSSIRNRSCCVLFPSRYPESNGRSLPAINWLICSLMIRSNVLDKADRMLIGL